MLRAICFVPQPPMIDPEISQGAAAELAGLREACTRALTSSLQEHGTTTLVGTATGIEIARWMLCEAEVNIDVITLEVRQDATRRACQELANAVKTETLVVVGDGSARRSPSAPGSFDMRAESFDLSVHQALRDADMAALMQLDPQLADDVMVAGRAPWQVGAAAAMTASGAWTGNVSYFEDRYGVAYFVAQWNRSD